MYVCGITVYDYCHLGHARAAVVFDMVFRYLKHKGFDVDYVRNFTDIDDKIINRANESQTDWREITKKFIDAFHEDMKSLGNLPPTQEPKATDFIEAMQQMISELEEKGLAYQAGGDVFYSVRKFPSYGTLSQKNIEDLEIGARVEVHEEKKDPLDFALWKGAKPGEPRWPSPWGEGRPGWHIECSAMSTKLLGSTLDIHGGGRDLTFPHHENERAQSEGATGKAFVKYWIHNGFVNLNADKMSKSTGNFLTIRDVLKKFSFETIRYFLLASHYRSPLDFTEQNMQDAQAAVERVYETMRRVHDFSGDGEKVQAAPSLDITLNEFQDRFEAAMDDDFNSAQALGVVFELVREVNRFLDQQPDGATFKPYQAKIIEAFALVHHCFGIFGQKPQQFFTALRSSALQEAKFSEADIHEKIAERKAARTGKDFVRADQIRDELAAAGIVLKDNPDGTTTWTVK